MPVDDILLEAEEKMLKTEEVVMNEFAGVRTGKASPSLVENILVEVYGSMMRIRELAGITAPEARMLLIQPWDTTSIQPIEKAIQKSNLGLNPAVQGKFIRLVLPELSTERRQEYVKLAHKMTEHGRVAVRHVRRDAIEHLKKEPMPWQIYAWLLWKGDERDAAISVLARAKDAMPDDEAIRDNLVALQNGKKMSMSSYGDLWYQFALEEPKMPQMPRMPHPRTRAASSRRR